MVGFFLYYFFYNSSAWSGLAIGFGAVWLASYWPPLFKKPWLWAVLVSSAFLTMAAVCYIQNPLVNLFYGETTLSWLWSHGVLGRFVFLAGIPLLKGLIQEGAKLVPVVVWWRRSGKNLDLKLGLIIGAVAGAGFGICEAHRALSYIFASGWDPNYMQFDVVNGFWGIFFTVAGQVAFSALAGYGLARGWGWQFYLIASSLHGLLFMARSRLFPICGTASSPHFEYSLEASVYTAVLAGLVTAWALWLRWRKEARLSLN
jgi:RsiW-degrading membrane proteinase PrsW (M82 family)